MTTAVEDALLITRTLAGDSKSYSLLYSKYWKRVYSFLRKRVNNNAIAEELTQEVFISAFKYLPTYKKELSGFYTWLCTIALNKASKQPYNGLFLEVDGVTTITPENLLNTRQEVNEVMSVIDTLPQKQQRALYMRVYDGMCYTDISQQLAVSPGYARKLVSNAKKHIRDVVRR